MFLSLPAGMGPSTARSEREFKPTSAANPKFARFRGGICFANFGFKSGTGIIELRVSFAIPKFAQTARQTLANFGIGTLGEAAQ
jgi:hypothetical protein